MKSNIIRLVLALVIGASLLHVGRAYATAVPDSDGCDHDCPVVHFEWNETVYDNCPAGYSVRSGHSDQCRKNTPPFTIIARPSHVVNHEADVAYEKSQDPNKCHRPSDDTLEDEYGMNHDARQDFKNDHSEWMNSIDVVPEGYYHEEGVCYPKTPVCTDEVANNDQEVTDKTYSDNEECTYDSHPYCVENETVVIPDNEQHPEISGECVDVCSNLEGNQAELPEGYSADGTYCYIPEQPTDVCNNLEGIQEQTPEGMVNDDGICTTPEEPRDDPKDEPKEEHRRGGGSEDATCESADAGDATGVWIEPLGNGMVSVHWTTPTDSPLVRVDFGYSPDNLEWSVITGNDEEYTLEGLTPGLGVNVRVTGISACDEEGVPSEVIDPVVW